MREFKYFKQIRTSLLQSNTTVLNKTHFGVTLARPALINSSATQYQGAAIFPKK